VPDASSGAANTTKFCHVMVNAQSRGRPAHATKSQPWLE
jgi:hypothetical protein